MSSQQIFNSGYSLIPAFKIGKHFELFAGGSINYIESSNIDAQNVFSNLSLWKGKRPAKLQQVYIGYQAGMQFIF